MIKLIYPEDGAILNTHTDLQDGFISRVRGEGIEMALEWLMSQKNGCDGSAPRKITFSRSSDEGAEYRFEISEKIDFSDAFLVKTREACCIFDNLETYP